MNRSILIVDDDLGIRETLKSIFIHAGYEPEEACTGAEALQKIQVKEYDLITMDMSMAEMDGVDTISVIRGETQTPIMVISAFLTEKIKGDLQKRNVHNYLDKPFTLDEVLGPVRKILGP
jgi:DNA-binding response OmpR family regulator